MKNLTMYRGFFNRLKLNISDCVILASYPTRRTPDGDLAMECLQAMDCGGYFTPISSFWESQRQRRSFLATWEAVLGLHVRGWVYWHSNCPGAWESPAPVHFGTHWDCPCGPGFQSSCCPNTPEPHGSPTRHHGALRKGDDSKWLLEDLWRERSTHIQLGTALTLATPALTQLRITHGNICHPYFLGLRSLSGWWHLLAEEATGEWKAW